jgi:hypothetical protein
MFFTLISMFNGCISMRFISIACLPVAMAFAVSPRSPTKEIQVQRGVDRVSELGPIFSQVTPQLESILNDLNGKILVPLQQIASKRAQEAQARHDYYDSTAPQQQALGLAFLSPFRILRLSATAWVLAEVLDYFGVLDDPKATGDRVVKVFQQHANLSNLQSKAKNWWIQARQDRGLLNWSNWTNLSTLCRTMASWQTKHQFAMGASLGLLFSEFVRSVATKGLKVGIGVYVLAEINHMVKRQSGKSIAEQIGSKYASQVQDALDSVRITIRKTAAHPQVMMEILPELIQQVAPNGECPPPGALSGLLVGIIVGVAIV